MDLWSNTFFLSTPRSVCFSVYDLNNDDYISRDEMFHLLKNSLISQPNEEDPDEGIKDLVEITLKKMVWYHFQKDMNITQRFVKHIVFFVFVPLSRIMTMMENYL